MALRNWLTSRKTELIFEKIIDHMQKVLETVHEFERAFEFFAVEKNPDLAYTVFQRVLDLEHEEDRIRRDVLLDIIQSDMNAKLREDIMKMITRIDEVANSADHAARRIMAIDPKVFDKLGDQFLKLMNQMVQKSVSITKMLFNLVKRIYEITNEELFEMTGLIRKYEHECDVLHSQIYVQITKLQDLDLNPFVAIQISDFINLVEGISNRVENVSDYIELLKIIE